MLIRRRVLRLELHAGDAAATIYTNDLTRLNSCANDLGLNLISGV